MLKTTSAVFQSNELWFADQNNSVYSFRKIKRNVRMSEFYKGTAKVL